MLWPGSSLVSKLKGLENLALIHSSTLKVSVSTSYNFTIFLHMHAHTHIPCVEEILFSKFFALFHLSSHNHASSF